MTVRRRIGAALLALPILLFGRPVAAAKWHTCPEPEVRYPRAASGAYTTAWFVHPGHEMGFFIRESHVWRTGGFSTEPDGNTVEITFQPIGGAEIPMPPFTATAVDPTTLYFTFPDPRDVLGRMVVGPARFVVRTAAGVVVDARRPLVLPPATEVLDLVDGVETEFYGAVDEGARLWMPVQFYRFGDSWATPACPAVLAPVVSVALEISLRATEEDSIPWVGFSDWSRTRMYLGDFFVAGMNIYGTRWSFKPVVSRPRRGTLAICGLNDAHDLIFMARMRRTVLGPRSDLAETLAQGSPLRLRLRNVSAELADELAGVSVDSFGAECGGF